MKFVLEKPLLSLLILILICTLSVFAFTYKLDNPILDISEDAPSNIANTINGLTTPILSVVTIVLVYLTFRDQRRFIDKQKAELDRQASKDAVDSQRQADKDLVDLILVSLNNLITEINSVDLLITKINEPDKKVYAQDAWVHLFRGIQQRSEKLGSLNAYEYFADLTHYDKFMFIFACFVHIRKQIFRLNDGQVKDDLINYLEYVFKTKLKFLGVFAGIFNDIDKDDVNSVKELINIYSKNH